MNLLLCLLPFLLEVVARLVRLHRDVAEFGDELSHRPLPSQLLEDLHSLILGYWLFVYQKLGLRGVTFRGNRLWGPHSETLFRLDRSSRDHRSVFRLHEIGNYKDPIEFP